MAMPPGRAAPAAASSVLRSTDQGRDVVVEADRSSRRSAARTVGAHDPDTGARSAAVDCPTSPSMANKVYAVWEDAVPAAPTIGRILFSQSSDGGQTWSAPVVHQPHAGRDRCLRPDDRGQRRAIRSACPITTSGPTRRRRRGHGRLAGPLLVRLHERVTMVRDTRRRTVRHGAGAGCPRLLRR